MAENEKVKALLESLSEEQKKRLHKDYIFRKERNETIRELAERGVRKTILIEVTGLSKSTILRIVNGDKRLRSPLNVKDQDLVAIERSFIAFSRELGNFLRRYHR